MPKRKARGSQAIPSAQNFSPAEIKLSTLLELAHQHDGHRADLREAVRTTFYGAKPVPLKGGTVWGNVVSGLTAYGVLDAEGHLTEVGQRLYALRADNDALHRELALHLLLHVHGVALIECLLDMNAAGDVTTLPTIRKALAQRGLPLSTAGKSISLLRSWLAEAGLFRSQWVPDSARYESLLGLGQAELDALSALTTEQRATVKQLATLGVGHYDSSDLRHGVETAHRVELNEKQFPKDVLYPLEKLGYIRTSRKGGRGWTLDVEVLPKVEAEALVPVLEQTGGLPPGLRDLLRLSLVDIVRELDTADINRKGLALEALAFKVMRSVGLSYVRTRYRPKGGRFEVDLLFDDASLAYQRWQVQSKNTDRVSVEDIAKEVGQTYTLNTTVIVMITRGVVGEDARRYAVDVMRKTNLTVVLIDGSDVKRIIDDPLQIFDVLQQQAAFARTLKSVDAISGSTASCTQCAAPVSDDASFCSRCGQPVAP